MAAKTRSIGSRHRIVCIAWIAPRSSRSDASAAGASNVSAATDVAAAAADLSAAASDTPDAAAASAVSRRPVGGNDTLRSKSRQLSMITGWTEAMKGAAIVWQFRTQFRTTSWAEQLRRATLSFGCPLENQSGRRNQSLFRYR
jgi:hypothetical protein